MSGCVRLQLAGSSAAARLSPIWAGGLFLEGSAVWVELDSGPPHPASTRANKDTASVHPNRMLSFSVTMLLLLWRSRYASLMVTAGPAHRGMVLANRTGTWDSMPSTC